MHAQEVAKICRLARLHLSAEECERFAGQLTTILEYFDQLQEVDTRNTAPLTHPGDLSSPLRDDEVRPWPDPRRLVPGAEPDADAFFRVPRIL